jgi:hypothetical protein
MCDCKKEGLLILLLYGVLIMRLVAFQEVLQKLSYFIDKIIDSTFLM